MKPLKAYEVYDGGDSWAIVFARHNVVARREGANECGCEFNEVDHCHRKRELDQYAPGPVPPQALIEIGWGYECRRHGCSNWARAGDEYVVRDGFVFCCGTCQAIESGRERQNDAARAAMIELVDAWLPGVLITEVHVYGTKLEPAYNGGGHSAYADFTFDGARHLARWVFGEAGPRVHGDDWPAFDAAYPAFSQVAP